MKRTLERPHEQKKIVILFSRKWKGGKSLNLKRNER